MPHFKPATGETVVQVLRNLVSGDVWQSGDEIFSVDKWWPVDTIMGGNIIGKPFMNVLPGRRPAIMDQEPISS